MFVYSHTCTPPHLCVCVCIRKCMFGGRRRAHFKPMWCDASFYLQLLSLLTQAQRCWWRPILQAQGRADPGRTPGLRCKYLTSQCRTLLIRPSEGLQCLQTVHLKTEEAQHDLKNNNTSPFLCSFFFFFFVGVGGGGGRVLFMCFINLRFLANSQDSIRDSMEPFDWNAIKRGPPPPSPLPI